MRSVRRTTERITHYVLWVVALLSMFVLSLHGAQTATEPKPISYTLAADGLPQDGIWKSTPVVADVNRDGDLDIVAHPRLGKGPRVWLGDGQGEWREASQGLEMELSCGGGVALGHINSDGWLDLAVADHCHGLFVYLGNASGRWQAVTRHLVPASAEQADAQGVTNMFSGAESVALGDVNEDSHLDMVAAASDRGGFAVYFGDGSGKDWRQVTDEDGLPSAEDPEPKDLERGGWANVVRLFDVNQDGHLDVVASYFRGPGVWLGDGQGRWRSASAGLPRPRIGGLFRGIAVADINRDKRPDLVAANAINGVEIYLQNEDGSWQAPIDPLPPLQGGAMSILVEDLDGDAHLELVAGGRLKPKGTGYGLFVLHSDREGRWQQLKESGLPERGLRFTWGIAAGDVNKDGVPDLAVATGGETGGTEQLSKGEMPLPQLQVWVGVRNDKGS
jgi:hypothetical protein